MWGIHMVKNSLFWCISHCYAEPHISFPQGATDSEKRVLCLSAENESLKQNLSVTQGLLQQLSTIPSQSSTMLIKVMHQHSWELFVVLPRQPSVTANTNSCNLVFLCALLGEWKPPQQSAAAGDMPSAACWPAVTPGATERTKWVEERRRAEETRGPSEGAAAGVGQGERQGASGEGKTYLRFWHST